MSISIVELLLNLIFELVCEWVDTKKVRCMKQILMECEVAHALGKNKDIIPRLKFWNELCCLLERDIILINPHMIIKYYFYSKTEQTLESCVFGRRTQNCLSRHKVRSRLGCQISVWWFWKLDLSFHWKFAQRYKRMVSLNK